MSSLIIRGLRLLFTAVTALAIFELSADDTASAFSLVQAPVSLSSVITTEEDGSPCLGIRGCYRQFPATPEDLPESLRDLILQDAAQRNGQPVSSLRIATVRKVIWSDGCMGNYQPDSACTLALVSGWAVAVASDLQQWLYSASEHDRFAYISSFNEFVSETGETQDNPILPDEVKEGVFIFRRAPTGRWFDPPMTPGFRYQMLSNSLFTQLLNFPVGIDGDGLFMVSVGDRVLGQFHSSQSVDFVSLFGSGVSEFTISGIDPLVNATDPIAFPVRLAFDTV